MYDSKYTGQQIEEMLEQAGSDLVTAGEDENYVVKVVDSEGTVLAGFKESGEIAVPIGLTDDAYTLIKALYDKLAEAVDYMKTLPTTGGGGSDLIEEGTDSTYVMKAQDEEGNLLVGFKESGELDVPIGITDDTYTLIKSLTEKLSDAIPALQDWASANFENSDGRKALIDTGSDGEYVLKMQDSEGNLLQGFKENGEVETPIGISDDTYMLINALYEKVNEIAQYLKDTK